MIISRKVELSDRAREFLSHSQIPEHDHRIQAVLWYLKHDTRLSELREVAQDAVG